ncbi:hypothetical protein CTheo_2441 [Ceratobasidium theobromae]|uniref:Transmembrane protein n=1 Tax=Ceratobasidium theobromae TaxID=1582974 RepID=A0A5N5QQX8_9AGAM|nr:hypothetical protein CTheo_2441 [Ceratobasidium theobromae]
MGALAWLLCQYTIGYLLMAEQRPIHNINVPLIKSPSLRVPRPQVELPPDIHPLPEDVTAYFVYPFTIEPHILTLESSRRTTLAAHATRREAYLRAREEDKIRRKKEALRRVAPGFDPDMGTLMPTKLSAPIHAPPVATSGAMAALPRSAMDDLVDQLAVMESRPSHSSQARPNNIS